MWTKYIKSKTFTKIKTEGTKRLKDTFPNIFFTTSSKTSTLAKFPTVYVRQLQWTEQGADLEGRYINGILAGFQIEVTDNESENNVDTVADVILGIMKELRFTVVGSPFSENTGSEYRNVARYQRMIGANDIY